MDVVHQTQIMKGKDMSSRIKPIPSGFHTLTPHLIVKGASKAIVFYKKAFGAEEIARVAGRMENLSSMLILESGTHTSFSLMSSRRWIAAALKASVERPSPFTSM